MKHTVVFFVTILSFIVQSQQKMTLDACIKLATENNIDVAKQQTNNLKLEHDKTIAKGTFLPNLNFNATQDFNLGNSFNVSTNVGQLESRSNTFYLTSSMVLFNGLSNTNKHKLSKMHIENGKLQLRNIQRNLEISVTNQYLQALLFKETVQIAKNRLENSTEQLARVKALYHNESITKSEMLEHESLVESDKNSVIETQNNYKNALITLKEVLAIEDIETFDIEDVDVSLIKADTLSRTEEVIQASKLEQHPAILVLASKEKIAEQNAKVDKGAFYPKVTFDYSYGTGYYHLQGREDVVFNRETNAFEANGFFKQLDNNRLHYLGFSVVVPIFNRFVTRETYKKRKLEQNFAALQLQQGKKEILNETRQAYNNVLTAKAALQSNKKILDFQEEAFKVSEEKYKLNISSVYEFIESRNRLLMAQTDYVKAKYSYLLKLKILKFYYKA